MIREPEWGDTERDRMLALGHYERGICDCGLHESVASDRDNFFTFEDHICPVCRGSAQFARIQAQADDRADSALGEKPPAGAPRSSDGRRTFTRQLTPSEVSARRSESIAQQPPRNQH